jgi:hypothetical protein
MKRAPGSYESRSSMKARSAATLITDYERKAAITGIPNLHFTDGINYATELHAAPRMRPSPRRSYSFGKGNCLGAEPGRCSERWILRAHDCNAICILRKLIKVTREALPDARGATWLLHQSSGPLSRRRRRVRLATSGFCRVTAEPSRPTLWASTQRRLSRYGDWVFRRHCRRLLSLAVHHGLAA